MEIPAKVREFMGRQFPIVEKPASALIGFLILCALYATSLHSYLLFHSLAEMFSIVVACGIFMIAWNARRYIDNGYFLFLGIAYLFVGSMDLLHTLSYTGMGVFQGYTTNLPTQLWISTRYLESISLLIAPLAVRKRMNAHVALAVYAVVFSLLIGAIFYWRIFPNCFIEGMGLTPFKKTSEFIISAILLASIATLLWKRREFDARVLHLLVASIVVTVCSELSFTLYAEPYGFWNLNGHILKIISFYLIYKAIIVEGLREPYRLLFRNLKQSEEAFRESEGRYRRLSESLEETVEKKVAELRQAQSLAALGQMVSVVAHEIRNPLQNISMGLDALRREMPDDNNKLEILAEIDHGVTVLNSTVKELLEYSRPVRVEYESWLIRELVQQALNMLGEKLRNITVNVDTQNGDPAVPVDGPKLVRVFVNLFLNAADAMPNGGTLKIYTELGAGDSQMKISVTDTGTGIDEVTLERIQEPFFTTKVQGTGLGLPICKKIVEAHNGHLTIKSKSNQGTTVEITLPAIQA